MEIDYEEDEPNEQFHQTDMNKGSSAASGSFAISSTVPLSSGSFRCDRTDSIEIDRGQGVQREVSEKICRKAIQETAEEKERKIVDGDRKVSSENIESSVDQRQQGIG